MAQIKEYTPRNIYNPTERRESRLSLPDSIARAEGGRNAFVYNAKTVLKGAGEIAQVVVDMKTSYDKAKANEFLNHTISELNNKEIEIKKNKQLGDARFVSSEMADFQQNLLSNYKFENEEQKQYAAERFNTICATSLSSISKYEADQIQKFEFGQAEATLVSAAEMLSASESPDTDLLSLSLINEDVKTMYPGASQELISIKTKEATSKALLANIRNASISNAPFAFARVDTEFFRDNMSNEDYEQARKNAIEANVKFYANEMANQAIYGNSTAEPSSFYSSLSEEEAGYAKAKILEEFKSSFKVKKEEQNKAFNDVYNSALLNYNPSDERSVANVTKLLAQIHDGSFFLQELNTIKFGQNDLASLSRADINKLSSIQSRIEEGIYQNPVDLMRDAQGLSSVQKGALLNLYRGNLKRQEFVKKSGGKDFEDIISSEYYDRVKDRDAKPDSFFFPLFKREVINRCMAGASVASASAEVFKVLADPNSDSGAVLKAIKEGRKEDGTINKDAVSTFLETTGIEDFVEDEQVEEISNFILYGNEKELYNYVFFVRNNEEKSLAKREEVKREEERVASNVSAREDSPSTVIDYRQGVEAARKREEYEAWRKEQDELIDEETGVTPFTKARDWFSSLFSSEPEDQFEEYKEENPELN